MICAYVFVDGVVDGGGRLSQNWCGGRMGWDWRDEEKGRGGEGGSIYRGGNWDLEFEI